MRKQAAFVCKVLCALFVFSVHCCWDQRSGSPLFQLGMLLMMLG